MTMMEPFAPWLRDINRFVAGQNAPAAFIPPADVIVTDRGVTIHMDVPGLTTDELEIDLENDTLTVRGERPVPYQEERNGKERVWRHIERRFGRFERSLRVPGGLNPDAVDASMADGVLTMAIPRPEQPKPHRVRIHPGSGQQRAVEGTASEGTASEGTATSGAHDGGATEAGNAQSATTAA
jgi:HSP20 family protein